MRALLRAALGCTVMAGALLAAGPAHAGIVCQTAPTGGQVCYDNGAGGTAPGSGGVGGGGSNGIALPPPIPAAPAPYVPPAVNVPPPAAPRPAPYVAPKAPAHQGLAYVAPVQVGAQINGPAPSPNQPRKGFAPTENPVIAGVPAEGPSATATPTASPVAATPSATASATPSVTPSPSESSAEPIQGEQAASTMSPAPFFVGLLALLVIGAAAWQWRRSHRAG